MRVACLILGLIALATIVCAAKIPDAQRLLPVKNEVAGFGIVPETLIYAKGAAISNIYDGGYELYTKNGVVDAARQMYQQDKSYLEVTVHTMKSGKAALAFLKYWAKERGSKMRVSKAYSGFMVKKPNFMAYYTLGKYFVTVSAFGSEDNAKKNAEDFMLAIKKKM